MNPLNPGKHKQTVEEMNKTVQNLKIEAIKKHKLEMKFQISQQELYRGKLH